MASSGLTEAIVLIILILSLPAVAWFFKFRKPMIRKQLNILRFLEAEYSPRDKTYWYLGYLVGFRGKYRINRGKLENVYVLYTSPPYHVFFYLPIIWLFKKKERLEIIHQFREDTPIRGEAHIADVRVKSIKLSLLADLKDPSGYNVKELRIGENKYKVYYKGKDALELAEGLFGKLAHKLRLFRVSVDGSRKSVLVSFEPKSLDDIKLVTRELWRLPKEWTG